MSHDGVFVGVHVLRVDGFELLIGALLAVEKLQHHHAGYVLLQVGINAGNGRADSPVRIAHRLAEDQGGPEDQRQHGKGNQRQPPFHPQHDRDDSHQHEDVLEDGDHAGGEHLVQCVNVRGYARDQPPHGVFVIEADVHVLQVAEDLAAQVKHDVLTGPLHEVGLGIFEAEADYQRAYIDQGNLADASQGIVAEPGIKKTVRPAGCA